MNTIKLTEKQRPGIVSIMVTMIMMIVISLIVLGFAQISRREVRNSLDTQLSAQAYYAAESGINDARAIISSKGGLVADKPDCDNTGDYSTLGNGFVNSDGSVAYTCVLVDTSVPSLMYDIGPASTVVPLFSSSGAFGQLNFEWTPDAGGGNVSNCTAGMPGSNLPPLGSWNCPYPVLRIDIVNTGLGVSRQNLRDNTKSFFLKPVNGGAGSANFDSADGTIINASCNASSCKVGLDGVGSFSEGYMRVNTLYINNTHLTISSNPGKEFKGAQAQIDATGRAQDVLRRVVVAVDLTDANARPISPAAIVSGDSICKRFRVAPGYFTAPPVFGGGNNNPLCKEIAGVLAGNSVSCTNPHDIVLVLDESNSMSNKWLNGETRQEELKYVVNNYIAGTAGTDENHIAVVQFSTKPLTSMVLPFSDDSSLIRSKINALTLNSGTHYSTALNLAGDILGNRNGHSGARSSSIPKVIIFVSDGNPDTGESNSDILNITTGLKNEGVTIYTVGIEFKLSDVQLLNRMATDGSVSTDTTRYYTNAATENDFESFFQGVRSDISC